jgi:hypothetical protein
MSIVIDANTFAMVFDPNNALHVEFFPVKEWIDRGEGFLLFGGTKFMAEMGQSLGRLRLIRLLKESGKAVEIETAIVDKLEQNVIEQTRRTKCNDQHIIALLAAARCHLLSSRDAKSFSFIKEKTLYPKGMRKVRIYFSSKNRALLKPTRNTKISNSKK